MPPRTVSPCCFPLPSVWISVPPPAVVPLVVVPLAVVPLAMVPLAVVSLVEAVAPDMATFPCLPVPSIMVPVAEFPLVDTLSLASLVSLALLLGSSFAAPVSTSCLATLESPALVFATVCLPEESPLQPRTVSPSCSPLSSMWIPVPPLAVVPLVEAVVPDMVTPPCMTVPSIMVSVEFSLVDPLPLASLVSPGGSSLASPVFTFCLATLESLALVFTTACLPEPSLESPLSAITVSPICSISTTLSPGTVPPTCLSESSLEDPVLSIGYAVPKFLPASSFVVTKLVFPSGCLSFIAPTWLSVSSSMSPVPLPGLETAGWLSSSLVVPWIVLMLLGSPLVVFEIPLGELYMVRRKKYIYKFV